MKRGGCSDLLKRVREQTAEISHVRGNLRGLRRDLVALLHENATDFIEADRAEQRELLASLIDVIGRQE